jgi:hypothetical protein
VPSLIVDTAAEGANYGSHIEFVADLTKLVSRLIKSREITLREGGQLLAAAAHSDVGKTISVRVIALNDFHGNLESPGTFRTNATSPALPAGGVEVLAGDVAADNLNCCSVRSLVQHFGPEFGPLHGTLHCAFKGDRSANRRPRCCAGPMSMRRT